MMKQTTAPKLKTLALAILVVAPTLASAAPLERELGVLLDTHPLIKAAKSSVDGADARRDAAYAGFYPRVSVDAGYGREFIENVSASTTTLPNGDLKFSNSSTPVTTTTGYETFDNLSLSLTQPLYQGGRLQGQVDLAETRIISDEYALQDTTQRVLLEGITTYLQVARYQTLIELAKQNEASTREQLDLEQKRVERGGGIEVDALQAKTRLQVVRERTTFYRQQLRDVLASYQQIFGHPADLDRIQSVDIPDALIPESAETAIAEYQNKNPQVAGAFSRADVAFQQIAITESSMLPKIDLVARGNTENNKNVLYSKDELSIGLKFTWTLSLGGEELYQRKASLADHDAEYQRAVSVKNQFVEQVQASWNQVENGRERLALLEDAVSISRDVMNDRKRLRDAGRETALAALDAEVEYYGVVANKVNAMFDTRIAGYRLLAAMGALTPEKLGVGSANFAIPVGELVTDVEKL